MVADSPTNATEQPQCHETPESGVLYRSETPWPEWGDPVVYRVPLHGSVWEVVQALGSIPFEAFVLPLEEFITIPDTNTRAEQIVDSFGCSCADDLLTFADGGLAGVDLATQQQNRQIGEGLIRTLVKLSILLFVCASILGIVWVWGMAQ